jgi:basic membrane protein A
VDDEFDWVETTIQESVAPADAYQIMSGLADEEYDVIFGCAFGYMDTMKELSKEYSDIAWEHTSGFEYGDNLGLYFGRQYQTRYLVGIAAGMLDDVEQIGYVGAHPIPEVIRGINAMALGARSVDENVTIKTRFTNTWYDPPLESDAAQSLIDEGADLMAQHQDSPSALRTAADNDIWATGYQAPMGQHAGENYLTSSIWNWKDFYIPTVEQVHNDEWEVDFQWLGLDSGVVSYD